MVSIPVTIPVDGSAVLWKTRLPTGLELNGLTVTVTGTVAAAP